MGDDLQKMIFKNNLLYYLGDKQQKEVADAIGVSPQTFNTWCQGIAIPRMDKMQLLADYFGITIPDLLDENRDNPNSLLKRHLKNYAQLPDDQKKMVDELITVLQVEPENTYKIMAMLQTVLSFFDS